tara:strand:- start:4487 stop:4693 length:207 start_codon:yes stop_codon:yes gene_type:complete
MRIIHAPKLAMEVIDRMWEEAGYMGGNHTGDDSNPWVEFVGESLILLANMSVEEYMQFLLEMLQSKEE